MKKTHYLLFACVFLTACLSKTERLKSEWEAQKKKLDKLNQELKLKTDSFRQNRSLSADSAFRRRVEWLTNDIREIQVKMDTIDAELRRLADNKSESEREEEEERKEKSKTINDIKQ